MTTTPNITDNVGIDDPWDKNDNAVGICPGTSRKFAAETSMLTDSANDTGSKSDGESTRLDRSD